MNFCSEERCLIPFVIFRAVPTQVTVLKYLPQFCEGTFETVPFARACRRIEIIRCIKIRNKHTIDIVITLAVFTRITTLPLNNERVPFHLVKDHLPFDTIRINKHFTDFMTNCRRPAMIISHHSKRLKDRQSDPSPSLANNQ